MAAPLRKTVPAAAPAAPVSVNSSRAKSAPTGKPATGRPTLSVVGPSSRDRNGAAAQNAADRQALENRQAQLIGALNGLGTNVMITDAELNVIYMNESLQKLLKKLEPEMQKVYGHGFRADAILGRCIDEFHKNPSHQRKMLANESMFPFNTRIAVGPARVDLVVSMMKDPSGKTIGFSTEWSDVTDRLLEEEAYKAEVKTIADRMEFLRGACSTDLANAMTALASGDLTIELVPKTPLLEIPKQPDLALMAETFNALRNQTVKAVEAYNQAKDSLSTLLARTCITADTIATAAEEVKNGNEDLAQRTEEQASSLEETASSMEQMTATVKQNADNARHANQLAAQARDVADKGGNVVRDAVSSMDEINKASKRIADIISVIDEIAFQTNLLALNAAVEAARVGEQGRGFAVVAAEVRNLAGRSATAAKEIKALVQDSVGKVQEGSALVNQSGTQLGEITSAVQRVADIINEIAAASQEQAAGIEQVNKAVMQMDQITQQNAALVEEATATSQSMLEQTQELQTVVAEFRIEPHYLEQVEQQAASDRRKKQAPVERGTARGRTPAAPSRYAAPPREAQRPAPRRQSSFHADDKGFEEF